MAGCDEGIFCPQKQMKGRRMQRALGKNPLTISQASTANDQMSADYCQ